MSSLRRSMTRCRYWLSGNMGVEELKAGVCTGARGLFRAWKEARRFFGGERGRHVCSRIQSEKTTRRLRRCRLGLVLALTLLFIALMVGNQVVWWLVHGIWLEYPASKLMAELGITRPVVSWRGVPGGTRPDLCTVRAIYFFFKRSGIFCAFQDQVRPCPTNPGSSTIGGGYARRSTRCRNSRSRHCGMVENR